MLNLINIFTLTTALYTSYNTADITININKEELKINISSNLTSEKEKAFILYLLKPDNTVNYRSTISEYTINWNYSITEQTGTQYIAIGRLASQENETDIAKYKNFNETTSLNDNKDIYYNISKIDANNGVNVIKLNISEKETPMEELLTALSTAVQSAVTIFVEGFGGLTQIFYNGTEITFIGGVLIVGLAAMFLMMFLRWIVSFIKGI